MRKEIPFPEAPSISGTIQMSLEAKMGPITLYHIHIYIYSHGLSSASC